MTFWGVSEFYSSAHRSVLWWNGVNVGTIAATSSSYTTGGYTYTIGEYQTEMEDSIANNIYYSICRE